MKIPHRIRSVLFMLLTQVLIEMSSSFLFADDLTALSDEFNDASTLTQWNRVDEVEKWGANQLEEFDINKTRRGMMVMVPYSSVWYCDYRGVLVYKNVEGDFIVTTELEVSQRNGKGAPRSQFSLAGIMARTPRPITPQTWKPGGENYIFLSLGAADQPGAFQFEVKTTVNSDSHLQISEGANHATLRIARIGASMIALKKTPNSRWTVHGRYHRPDMPGALQVGLTCYTDWPTCEKLTPNEHNSRVIKTGNPDLVAAFDYVRYRRPQLPSELANKDLSSEAVTDDQLLQFLGEENF